MTSKGVAINIKHYGFILKSKKSFEGSIYRIFKIYTRHTGVFNKWRRSLFNFCRSVSEMSLGNRDIDGNKRW